MTSNSITLRTSTGSKTQTTQRSCILDDWPEDAKLRGSIFMDLKVTLLSWLRVRGSSEGFVFCDMGISGKGTCKLEFSKPLSSDRFTKLMGDRLSSIGIDAGGVRMCSGHSIERESVQIYRSLGTERRVYHEKGSDGWS